MGSRRASRRRASARVDFLLGTANSGAGGDELGDLAVGIFGVEVGRLFEGAGEWGMAGGLVCRRGRRRR